MIYWNKWTNWRRWQKIKIGWYVDRRGVSRRVPENLHGCCRCLLIKFTVFWFEYGMIIIYRVVVNKIYRLLVWVWLHLPSFVWISLLGWQNRRPLLWRSTHWEMSTGRLISCRNPVGKSLVTAVFCATFFEVRFDRLSPVRQFWFLERFTGPSPCARRFSTADKLRRRPWNQFSDFGGSVWKHFFFKIDFYA